MSGGVFLHCLQREQSNPLLPLHQSEAVNISKMKLLRMKGKLGWRGGDKNLGDDKNGISNFIFSPPPPLHLLFRSAAAATMYCLTNSARNSLGYRRISLDFRMNNSSPKRNSRHFHGIYYRFGAQVHRKLVSITK